MADQNVVNQVMQLRDQGLTDNVILSELTQQGVPANLVREALAGPPQSSMDDYDLPNDRRFSPQQSQQQPRQQNQSPPEGNIYERIEEIAEGIIDEKWDELIAEVKKIIDWKEKIELTQTKLKNDVDKLKEDFTVLHQGVLGKLEGYDTRMQSVGTELKAVGRVFKDVIPEFVENVKELSSVTKSMRKK